MSESRNTQLKRVYDLGGTLTPKQWAKAVDVIFPDPNEGNGKIIKTTYKDLVNMISSGSLIPGALYEFDYNNYLPIKDWNGELIDQYNTECQVRVKALSTNTISEDALYNGVRSTFVQEVGPDDGFYHDFKKWNPCKYSINTPYSYNLVYHIYSNESGTVPNDHFKTVTLGNGKDIKRYFENIIDPKIIENNSEFFQNLERQYINGYVINFIQEEEDRWSCELFTYELFSLNGKPLSKGLVTKRVILYDKAYSDKFRFLDNIAEQDIVNWESNIEIYLHPAEITGFVYDITIDYGKMLNPSSPFYSHLIKKDFNDWAPFQNMSFLSYDISVFSRIGQNVKFIGDINKDHVIYTTISPYDNSINNDYIIHHCEIINSWVYCYPYITFEGDSQDDVEPYELAFPILGKVINSRISGLNPICNRFTFNQFRPVFIENINLPVVDNENDHTITMGPSSDDIDNEYPMSSIVDKIEYIRSQDKPQYTMCKLKTHYELDHI